MSGFQYVDVAVWLALSVVGTVAWLGVPIVSRCLCPGCSCLHGGKRGGGSDGGVGSRFRGQNPAMVSDGARGARMQGGSTRQSEEANPPSTCCGTGTCGLPWWMYAAGSVCACFFIMWVVTVILMVAVMAGGWDVLLFTPVEASACQSTACKAGVDENCCSYTVPAGRLGEGSGYELPRDVWFSLEGAGKVGEGMHGWMMVNASEPTIGSAAETAGDIARNATGDVVGADGWLNILYFHGSGANLATEYRLARYNFLLARGKTRLFVFDYPAYGKSSGTLSGPGFLTSGERAMYAFRYLVQASGSAGWPQAGVVNGTASPIALGDAELKNASTLASATQIVVLGRSMGGPTAAHVVGKTDAGKDARAIILQSTFASLQNVIDFVFPVTAFAAGPALVSAVGTPMTTGPWISDWGSSWESDTGAASVPPCAFQDHSESDEWASYSSARYLYANSINVPEGPPPAAVPTECKYFFTAPESVGQLHSGAMTADEKAAIHKFLDTMRVRFE